MAEVIVITSGKGGVGKTTTTANLGVALCSQGKKVVLIDADIGLRNLDIALGCEDEIVYDWIDYVSGECTLSDVLINVGHTEGLFFLPASQTKSKNSVEVGQVKVLCEELKAHFDFILIDCPAGIDYGFELAAAAADKAFVITTPELSAVRNASRIASLLDEYKQIDYLAIINRIRPDLVKKGIMMSVDDILEILGFDLGGIVPEEPEIYFEDNRSFVSVKKKGFFAAEAYSNIAKRLCGTYVPLMAVSERKFVKRYKKHFGI